MCIKIFSVKTVAETCAIDRLKSGSTWFCPHHLHGSRFTTLSLSVVNRQGFVPDSSSMAHSDYFAWDKRTDSNTVPVHLLNYLSKVRYPFMAGERLEKAYLLPLKVRVFKYQERTCFCYIQLLICFLVVENQSKQPIVFVLAPLRKEGTCHKPARFKPPSSQPSLAKFSKSSSLKISVSGSTGLNILEHGYKRARALPRPRKLNCAGPTTI